MEALDAPERLNFGEADLEYILQVAGFRIAEVWSGRDLVCAGIFAYGPTDAHFHLSGTAPGTDASPHRAL